MAGSSLDQNPPNADRHITPGGSDWLWAVFAIMALSTLGMVAYSFMVCRLLLALVRKDPRV
jgi:bacteriorhodopsin